MYKKAAYTAFIDVNFKERKKCSQDGDKNGMNKVLQTHFRWRKWKFSDLNV